MIENVGEERPAPDATVLLRALRKPGDEVQLTRAIGELAQHDQRFARELLHLLVRQAPLGRKVTRLLGPPGRVDCELERLLYAPD